MKIGDKVFLVSGKYEESINNPTGKEGIIIKLITGNSVFPYGVDWGKGANVYRPEDLYSTSDKSLEFEDVLASVIRQLKGGR